MSNITWIDKTWHGEVIPPDKWGRDHWTTIAYAFTKAGGPLSVARLRPDSWTYPTRLHPVDGTGTRIAGHDDLACLEDAIQAGVLLYAGTGAFPEAHFTPPGLQIGQWLRQYIDGGRGSTLTLGLDEVLAGVDVTLEDLEAAKGPLAHV